MFSFFTRRKERFTHSDYGFLGIDIHSHLIPGIDDGVPDVETALACLRKLKEIGYRKVVTTPHIIQDLHPNTSEGIRRGLDKLRQAVREENLGMEVDAAAEYLLDDHFINLLQKDDVLTFGPRYLLFELPFAIPPLNLESLVFQMMTRGYQPILAHPERYTYLHSHPERLNALKEQGCLFQLNILSLAGQYGSRIQQQARKLVEHGMIDLLGSDMHRLRDAEKMEQLLKSKELAVLGGREFLNATLL
ncbi:tyrosine-protein phosphatase [Tellurirhabdus rosea]|uniref:tyrosine-protein phosphatase n=1 Tax=Tellurirhabdus rosea TaxID=2674997 RepID=UPI00224CA425|nr:CpsB/CapC family capsule biosynthesis tyrosine phosphatase [Tellurirhabdus rosea]